MQVDVEDGQVTIPEEVREQYGSRFELVDRGNKIVLVPIADDPLEALRDEFSDTEKSIEELKESTLQGPMEEAGR